MATRSANISVVPFGDGPQVAIGDLVGAKTVLLSGPFQGSYTLFASHNGTSFAPVLLFNSDGQEQIELTLAEAYAFVRLRTGANTTGSVTASISGVSVPGQNSFLTFPPVAINASGPQPSIDTFALVPPTGLEVDVNVICSATLLTGTIIVEGSNDNLNFNPLGSFSGGSVQRSLVGLPASLEFAPLPTPDVVRYFRINVQGQLLQPAIFTLAGGVPATGRPCAQLRGYQCCYPARSNWSPRTRIVCRRQWGYGKWLPRHRCRQSFLNWSSRRLRDRRTQLDRRQLLGGGHSGTWLSQR